MSLSIEGYGTNSIGGSKVGANFNDEQAKKKQKPEQVAYANSIFSGQFQPHGSGTTSGFQA